MSNLTKYVFGYVTWHQYMTRLQRTVAQGAMYQAAVTRETGLIIADEVRALSESQADAARSIELGLCLISDKLDEQTKLLEDISESLQNIHETLSAPERTKAKEQFQIGAKRLRSGLLKEALEAFHKAEAINEVDPVLQLAIGKIYLYGIDEGEVLINLELAQKHLLLAVRYSKLSEHQMQLKAEIHYHTAVLYFVLASEQKLSSENFDEESFKWPQDMLPGQ